jgi:diguanylate cyclase (GGDEF)-like protein
MVSVMTWRQALEPRDTRVAAATVSVLAVAAALIALAYEISARVQGEAVSSAGTLVVLGGVAGAGLAGWLLRRVLPSWLWAVVPFVGLAAIVAMDRATVDASAGAQLVLLFPVVYAGALLRRSVAWPVAAGAVAGDALVVFHLLPTDRALSDLANFVLTAAAITAVLGRSYAQQDRLVARLRHLADVDPLTGLQTRRGLALAHAGDGRPRRGTGLVLIDIDRFKLVNDTYGHPAGDAALVQVARAVQAAARPDETVVRLGGDELAVLLADCDAAVVEERARRFHQAVRSRQVLDAGRDLGVTVSIGAAHQPPGPASAGSDGPVALEDLYAAADSALYLAKQRGRDRVVVSSAGSRTERPAAHRAA